MKVQAVNNTNGIYNTNFGHCVPKVHHTPKCHLNGKSRNTIAERNIAENRQKKVMHGAIAAGLAQAMGGAIPVFINQHSLGLVKLFGALCISGLITAVVGMTESDKIADFLKNKGILK